jgi:acetylornithine deacetylase
LPIDPLKLTRELIDVPSVTGEERAVGERLETILRSIGLTTERQPVSETRFNLLARAGGTPGVLLCTHIDTVPPFFPSAETGERIFGRGACDTKGAIAAMISAAERLVLSGIRDFGLLLVVGEETDSIGARLANERFSGIGARTIIVGEPTGSKWVRGAKGTQTVSMRFRGRAAHSAYPELGDSAIAKMARAISRIETAPWGGSDEFGETTVNVGVARGGVKANVIPADAEIEMIFRLGEPPASVRQRLEAIAAEHDATMVVSPGNPPVRMAVPDGEESIVVAFGSDIPYLGAMGTPMLFGPGSILDAHAANESISKKEIADAVDTYCSVVARLVGGNGAHGKAQ